MTEQAMQAETQAPVPPIEPLPHQCCGNGCDPCIYDTYNAELRAYYLQKAQWDAQQAAADSAL